MNLQRYWAHMETQCEAAGSQRAETIHQPIKPREQTNWKIISRFYFICHSRHIIQCIILFESLSNEGVNQQIFRQEFTGWLMWNSAHVSDVWKQTFLLWLKKKKESDEMLDYLSLTKNACAVLINSAVWPWLVFFHSATCPSSKWPWWLPSRPTTWELKTKLLLFFSPTLTCCYAISWRTVLLLALLNSRSCLWTQRTKWD